MIDDDRERMTDLDRAARTLRAAVATARSLGATVADVDRFVADGLADADSWSSTQPSLERMQQIRTRTGYRPSSADVPPSVPIPPIREDEMSPAMYALAHWRDAFDDAA